MKRTLVLLWAMLVLMLVGCGKISGSMEITCDSSRHYSRADIHDAIGVVETYFCRNFDGCTLTAIGYIGDEKQEDMEKYAAEYGAEQAIVLTSSFDTGRGGGDGSLNANETYRNWKWILIRDSGGSWSHVDHGYG